MSDKELLEKLHTHFAGKIVRKDLTKKIKEGANVPVYVLEYLLGMYCASRDEEEIEAGVRNVKQILADNYVRPDEAQKIISKLREKLEDNPKDPRYLKTIRGIGYRMEKTP